jgi:hypothetical protein
LPGLIQQHGDGIPQPLFPGFRLFSAFNPLHIFLLMGIRESSKEILGGNVGCQLFLKIFRNLNYPGFGILLDDNMDRIPRLLANGFRFD